MIAQRDGPHSPVRRTPLSASGRQARLSDQTIKNITARVVWPGLTRTGKGFTYEEGAEWLIQSGKLRPHQMCIDYYGSLEGEGQPNAPEQSVANLHGRFAQMIDNLTGHFASSRTRRDAAAVPPAP